EFLAALDEFHPDIILSDNDLPRFSAGEALEIVNTRPTHIPFIMVTGTVNEEFAANIIKSGADDYILKDRLHRLPSAISKAIKHRKAEKDKQEAEQKIIESESNLRAIFENTSEGFLLLDKRAVIRAFNTKAGRYIFVNQEKELKAGHSIFDYVEQERKAFFHDIITKALNGKKYQYERAYERKNGPTSWIEFSIIPVIEQEEINGICITGRDISEKKIAEQQKEFDSHNNNALINNTEDLMWSVDRDMKLITCNEAFARTIEMASGKPLMKGESILSEQFTPKQNERYKLFYDRALSGEIFTIIDFFEFPSEFWVEVSFYPIRKDNEVIGTACFSRDITQRKKDEKEITDYKNALDQSSIISITDEKGIIIHVNKNFCRISRFTKEELLNQDNSIINSRHHPKSFIKELWKTISNGQIWRGEFCNKARDGSIYWIDATIVPLLNAKRKPVQYLAIGNEITDKKRLEKEMVEQKIQQQKKMIDAIIAAQEKERTEIGRELHDNVNQMLGAIHLYIDMAKKNDTGRDSLLTDASRFTLEAIQEIRKLTKTLITPMMQEIGLQDIIQDLIKQIMTVHPIQIIFTTNNFIEDSATDKFKLNIFRIIQEQLNNILKHAKAKKVEVNITEDETRLLLTVGDDGIGFDTAKRNAGVGITNIKSRCELYRGNMKLDSAPGKGTVLTIDFNLTDILIQQGD
ncbi:MAG TPA: PAS domain S-box protein, partial [Ferruginibacter sp.]|nr:PAS domain S-box protein [Ferruginibacter sp.]